MSEITQPELLEEGERLLLGAFDLARASGRGEWQRMRTTVLKNRMLTATDRNFSESRWGVEKFTDFLRLFPTVVAVDSSENPPVVTLVAPDGLGEHQPAGDDSDLQITRASRVRPDLWDGVLNYSSGAIYVWDAESARCVGTSDESDSRPQLPTIDKNVLSEWRRDFAAIQSERVSPRQRELLDRWGAEGGRTSALPSSLRGLWNAELKRRVVERLESWFRQEGLDVPDDLLVASEPRATGGAEPSTANLRSFIQRTVAAMTRRELETLELPAAAVLRAHGAALAPPQE